MCSALIKIWIILFSHGTGAWELSRQRNMNNYAQPCGRRTKWNTFLDEIQACTGKVTVWLSTSQDRVWPVQLSRNLAPISLLNPAQIARDFAARDATSPNSTSGTKSDGAVLPPLGDLLNQGRIYTSKLWVSKHIASCTVGTAAWRTEYMKSWHLETWHFRVIYCCSGVSVCEVWICIFGRNCTAHGPNINLNHYN